jgi:tyrosinase
MPLVSGWSDLWLSGIDLTLRLAAAGGTMGVRKSVYALTAAEVEALREAFLAVMGLRDERGYQYHAGLHGLPLPIQCRHGDILFLPWHRAYLYFFELALQDRMPEVAIPWWDWTSATAHQEGLPPAHAPQAREDGRPNPLFDSEVLLPPAELDLVRERLPGALTDDDPPRTRRDSDLPDELPRDRTIRSILQAPTFSDFSFRLENVHNDVHVWVGGSMSAVPVAGFDPVFWSHHAMIDRLWYLWQLAHPGSLPPAQTLDLALAPFPMTVRQTLDISLLGYEYAVQTS